MVDVEDTEAPWDTPINSWLNGTENGFLHDDSPLHESDNVQIIEQTDSVAEVQIGVSGTVDIKGSGPTVNATAAAKKTVCLSLTIKRFGTRRRASTDLIDTEADRAMLYLGKDILDSKELKAIQTLHNEARNYLRKRALPGAILKHGLYLIAAPMVPQIDEKIEEFRKKEKELVAAFMEVYPSQVESAKARLKNLYNASDYPQPSAVSGMFGITTNWLSLKVHDSLKEINKEIWTREQEKFEAQWQQTLEEVKDGLRGGLAEMVNHLVDRLSPDVDGKKKTFKKSTIANLKEFLDVFDSRNITEDGELQSIVTKAKNLLEGVNPDDLRKHQSIKDSVLTGFSQIKKELEGLTVEKTGRMYSFEEDE